MQLTETDFLRRIRSNPNDDDQRLMFSDWLTERGDARAEFIRIELQIQQQYRSRNVTHLIEKLMAIVKSLGEPKNAHWVSDLIHLRAAEILMPLIAANKGKSRKRKRIR